MGSRSEPRGDRAGGRCQEVPYQRSRTPLPRSGEPRSALGAGRDLLRHAALAAGGCQRGAEIIVERLRSAGVPVEVHEPEIYLSIPLSASVAGGRRHLSGQAAFLGAVGAAGAHRELVRLTANPKALRSYNRDIATLFGGSITLARRGQGEGRRQDRRHVGLRQSGADLADRGMGRHRPDRRQSRRRHPLGHLHHDLGLARSRRSAAQAEDPGRRGQQSRGPEAHGAR